MKHIIVTRSLCLLGLTTLLSFAQAQDSLSTGLLKKRNFVKLELVSFGASMDLSHTDSKNSDAGLLGSRQGLAFSSAFRLTHLFSQKLGWYTALKLDYLKEKRSEHYTDFPIGEILLRSLYGGFVPSYSLEGGLVYRIEKGRWDFHPRLGFGYGMYLLDRDSDKSQKQGDGTFLQTVYTQRASGALMNLGFTGHYFLGKKSFLALNIDFRQPLQESYGELTSSLNGGLEEHIKYSNATVGRALQLAVGYGFTLGKRKL